MNSKLDTGKHCRILVFSRLFINLEFTHYFAIFSRFGLYERAVFAYKSVSIRLGKCLLFHLTDRTFRINIQNPNGMHLQFRYSYPQSESYINLLCKRLSKGIILFHICSLNVNLLNTLRAAYFVRYRLSSSYITVTQGSPCYLDTSYNGSNRIR